LKSLIDRFWKWMDESWKLLIDWFGKWMESFAESEPKEQMGMMADAALVASPLLLALYFPDEAPKAIAAVFSTLFVFVIVSFVYASVKFKNTENVSKWFKAIPYVLLIYTLFYFILRLIV
jgi:hypothetical protein